MNKKRNAMTTMELDALKAEVAREVLNTDDEVLLKKALDIFGGKKIDKSDLPAGRIPGFPYTDEERRESVRQAMKEIRNGAPGYTSDEVRAMIPR